MSITINDLKVGAVVTLKKDFNYKRIYACHPSENKKYIIREVYLNAGWGLSDIHGCIRLKDTSSRYPIECIESIVSKENDGSKKKWKLDEIPTNTYIHNFPSKEELQELVKYFAKKFQNGCHYLAPTNKNTTLYISKEGGMRIFDKCHKDTDKTIIDYSNIIIEGKKEKGKIKIKFKDLKYPCVITDVKNDSIKKEILAEKAVFPGLTKCDVKEIVFYPSGKYDGYCHEKGWCSSNEPYKNYTFYSFDEIDFGLGYAQMSVPEWAKNKKVNIHDLKVPWVITNIQNRDQIRQLQKILKISTGTDLTREFTYNGVNYGFNEGDGIGWYKQNKPYCNYNFYDYNDIDFSEKISGLTKEQYNEFLKDLSMYKVSAGIYTSSENTKHYKSKIDTKAPKIVGEYSSAYRKYKPKKGE